MRTWSLPLPRRPASPLGGPNRDRLVVEDVAAVVRRRAAVVAPEIVEGAALVAAIAPQDLVSPEVIINGIGPEASPIAKNINGAVDGLLQRQRSKG